MVRDHIQHRVGLRQYLVYSIKKRKTRVRDHIQHRVGLRLVSVICLIFLFVCQRPYPAQSRVFIWWIVELVDWWIVELYCFRLNDFYSDQTVT